MNYKPLKNGKAHESIPIVNKWGEESFTYWMPNSKYRRRARVRKSSFWNYHSKGWFRQQSSMGAKPRRRFWWVWDIYMVTEYFPTDCLPAGRLQIAAIQWRHRTVHWLGEWITINIDTERLMDMCASQCKALRSTQYHLHSILLGNTYPESHHEETAGKPKMRDVLLKKAVGEKVRGGGMWSSKMLISLKTKKKLWKCSRLKESKETWQLNAIPDHGMNSVLEEEKMLL